MRYQDKEDCGHCNGIGHCACPGCTQKWSHIRLSKQQTEVVNQLRNRLASIARGRTKMVGTPCAECRGTGYAIKKDTISIE